MGSNQHWAGRVYDLCVYSMTGTPEGSTEWFYREAGNRACDTWFTRYGLSPAPQWLGDPYPLHLLQHVITQIALYNLYTPTIKS